VPHVVAASFIDRLGREFNRVRIHYLSAQGVLEVEQGSLRELERSLPREWMGFAAFRLLARGSKLPLDVDLLVLTSNRILVVELKNWAGDIEYSAGQWIHKGTPKRSPVEVNDNKARVLKGFIKDRAGSARLNTQRPEISGLAAV